jgi:unsaturated rhamnogalacturonyl hydrolase
MEPVSVIIRTRNKNIKVKNMNKKFIISFVLLTFFVTLNVACQSQKINLAEQPVEKLSGLIADNFIKLHPDTVAYPTEVKSYRWNYEQGLVLDAFYQVWKETGDKRYYDYIKKNIDYYVEEDGTIKTYRMEDYNIDNISPGRVLLHLYSETNEARYRRAADTLLKQLQHHPRTSNGGFWHKKIYPYQMWLDGLYMAQPFYSRYAVMFDKPEIIDDVINQFFLIEQNLKDDLTGLYYHGWDESKDQKWADPVTGRSPNFWGRSIGWFMMALVDVLDYIPEDHPQRNKLITILSDLSESLLRFRDKETGLWYQVVDQGDRAGNFIEASGSLMFIYAFAKAANNGLLDKEFYDIAVKCYTSVLNNLISYDDNKNFYVGNIVLVGGLGGNPYRDGSFEYYISEPIRPNDFKGYGPFLLAAVEIYRGISVK